MKKYLMILICTLPAAVYAQKLDFSLNFGSGKSYLFESLDRSVNVTYGIPLSLATECKFTPKNKSWGIKVRIHEIQSTISGVNWMENSPLNGYIHSLTTSLLLEKEEQKQKISYGYSFGLGLTKESLQPQQYNPSESSVVYPSLTIGSLLGYKLGKELQLVIQPILFWQDPFTSIGIITHSKKANLAREDFSVFLNFGIRYRIIP